MPAGVAIFGSALGATRKGRLRVGPREPSAPNTTHQLRSEYPLWLRGPSRRGFTPRAAPWVPSRAAIQQSNRLVTGVLPPRAAAPLAFPTRAG